VAPVGLEKALDMFSGFFTCPLFTEGSTARELKAVDAEHAKNIQNDMWRLYQLDKSTGNPGHPYSKFGTGDSRTLQDIPLATGINVRENLLSFHKLVRGLTVAVCSLCTAWLNVCVAALLS
jgi:insulysin